MGVQPANNPPPVNNRGLFSRRSLTGGNQDPVLDETLASFPGGGVLIGDLFVNNCVNAVRILSKSRISDGKKMASDPAFGLAAQLLAARLNVQAGARVCSAATAAINEGQALLDVINFDGNTHTTLNQAQKTQANNLASILDSYNNDNLCP